MRQAGIILATIAADLNAKRIQTACAGAWTRQRRSQHPGARRSPLRRPGRLVALAIHRPSVCPQPASRRVLRRMAGRMGDRAGACTFHLNSRFHLHRIKQLIFGSLYNDILSDLYRRQRMFCCNQFGHRHYHFQIIFFREDFKNLTPYLSHRN